MKRYDVYLMSPYYQWEGVWANSEVAAIEKCDPQVWPDHPYDWLVLEAEPDGQCEAPINDQDCLQRGEANPCESCKEVERARK